MPTSALRQTWLCNKNVYSWWTDTYILVKDDFQLMLRLPQALIHIYQILPTRKQHLNKRTKQFIRYGQHYLNQTSIKYISPQGFLTVNIGNKVYRSKIQNNFNDVGWIHDQDKGTEDCHSSLFETKKTRKNYTACFIIIVGSIKARKSFHSCT